MTNALENLLTELRVRGIAFQADNLGVSIPLKTNAERLRKLIAETITDRPAENMRYFEQMEGLHTLAALALSTKLGQNSGIEVSYYNDSPDATTADHFGNPTHLLVGKPFDLDAWQQKTGIA